MGKLSSAKKKELIDRAIVARRDILIMTTAAGSGHPGGSLSATEILTYMYFEHLRIDPKKPTWADRDRFILSKGHCSPIHYSSLARRGFFNPEILSTFRKFGSPLQGHSDIKAPGVDFSAGSLGQGLSFANGIALAGRLDKKNYRVYCMIGDGESQEGQIWEAAMTASKYKLDNLCVILDNNGLQIDGPNDLIKSLQPLPDKWKAFGFHVIAIDGHDFDAIHNALHEEGDIRNKPTIIIAKTIKGKGISFMENKVEWHGKSATPEELQKALGELA